MLDLNIKADDFDQATSALSLASALMLAAMRFRPNLACQLTDASDANAVAMLTTGCSV